MQGKKMNENQKKKFVDIWRQIIMGEETNEKFHSSLIIEFLCFQ